ncbi:metalloregulator ArsR/SmtB family transcription factor [Actinotalea sp. JY-7876]|uniref:helix-turn-helix transcriptional regulator n=3 Tax=unclassified Actinotalea TaxID=2638618 RepID=UPI0021024A6E|nr:helix-turn-helix domain-containing protein [Actinotalea sp. JY-7876]
MPAVMTSRPGLAADPGAAPGAPTEPAEQTTRRRILRLVVEEGPVSAADLARGLRLTTAGVRRHVAALELAGEIVVHAVAPAGAPRRGRPARRYVATERGQAALSSAYSDLATQALAFLAEVGGPDAVRAFADRRVALLEERLLAHDADGVLAAGPHQAPVTDRVAALATGLAAEGYAASVRPVPGGRAVQLCQGHCPVQDVAALHPQLCEAEARLFSRLLDVHVQRLSTLAAGGHVCTTHVPVPTGATTSTRTTRHDRNDDHPAASDRPAPGTVEGTR